jgi:nucleotide-binding universal stress UspA family protein
MQLPFEAEQSDTHNHVGPVETIGRASDGQAGFHHIAACVDASGFAERVIPHALAIAAALGSPVTFLRVVEEKPTRTDPLDPVEWDIRLREAQDELAKLADEGRREAYRIDTQVIEGEVAGRISHWAHDHGVELTVLGTHGDSGVTEWGLGSTAQKLMDRAHGSLLLVPCNYPTERVVHYHRLLVPLDGSSHAESVLPLAIRLALAERAELVLVHVVPVPELTEIGPLESEAVELREQLIRRNERVGHEYLDRIRGRIGGDLLVRTRLVRGADARSGLSRAITDEEPDLIVLAAHGRSRRTDVPFGSLAAYLITHAVVPLLIVRRHPTHLARHDAATAHQTPVRLPTHAQ